MVSGRIHDASGRKWSREFLSKSCLTKVFRTPRRDEEEAEDPPADEGFADERRRDTSPTEPDSEGRE